MPSGERGRRSTSAWVILVLNGVLPGSGHGANTAAVYAWVERRMRPYDYDRIKPLIWLVVSPRSDALIRAVTSGASQLLISRSRVRIPTGSPKQIPFSRNGPAAIAALDRRRPAAAAFRATDGTPRLGSPIRAAWRWPPLNDVEYVEQNDDRDRDPKQPQ